MDHTATYSPEDNKLRIYPAHRLSAEDYARVKAAGFSWAPKQEIFVAPMWTPEREDIAREFAGEIGDEDQTLADRAEDRADRFEDYSENRARDAEKARAAVSAIADNIPFGQPILIGHHSERHARRDAEKIENGMRRAVKMWDTAEYWTRRAAAAVRHAAYKERPDVRARRIKTIESDRRKIERNLKAQETDAKLWALVDKPEAWKPREDGGTWTREQRAAHIAGRMSYSPIMTKDGRTWTAYDVLRPEDERYQGCPAVTVDEVLAILERQREAYRARASRWLAHYDNRLAYERAMLAESGGTVADKIGPEKGGACRCWASPGYGKGYSYIQKVNRVTVTVLDNYGNDNSRNFPRTIPFDKLTDIMTAAQVAEAHAQGRIAKAANGTGFYLRDLGDNTPAETRDEAKDRVHKEATARAALPADIAAMKQALREGIQVAVVPQLFPTPAPLAARMVALADLRPGMRILEPSAGTGAILDTLPAGLHVIACEINNALCRRLNTHPKVNTVIEGDFFDLAAADPKFDRILMNPPFANGADIRHIEHALTMLAPGGKLVAICANGPRQRDTLQPIATMWEDLPAGTFADQGTNVNAALLVIEG